MPTRTARTAWDGGLQDGSGQVELSGSKRGTFDVSFPKRASDDGGGATNPEELVAAAHSACYAMSLSNEIAQAGGTPHALDVTAQVTLGPDPAHGWTFRSTPFAPDIQKNLSLNRGRASRKKKRRISSYYSVRFLRLTGNTLSDTLDES